MNDKFDELAKGLGYCLMRTLLCIAAAGQVAARAGTEDLYVDANAAPGGDGSARAPYLRITDGVERARSDRQAGLEEDITIHVASGTYSGSYTSARLNREPGLEILPILINVPNLTLRGATKLLEDASDLPTGAQPGTETVITTDEVVSSPNFTASLILIAPTTDGGSGDGVTVSGFILDPQATVNLPRDGVPELQSIWVDRAANFEVRQNIVMRSGDGVDARMSSGTVSGNLFVGNGFAGTYLSGGNDAYPANVRIIGNRGFNNVRGGAGLGAFGRTIPLDLGANTLQSPAILLTVDPASWPNLLTATVNNNDFSGNVVYGLRCAPYPPDDYYKLKADLTARLEANVSGNLFNGNQNYGLLLDAGFPSPRSDRNAVSAQFDLALQNNALTGNGRATALLTFERFAVSLGTDSLKDFKYLSQSVYNLNDTEGETLGFDYDNPLMDPFDGTVLNNALIINGTVMPSGIKISPRNP
jgi:hypothetical protein